MAEQDAGTSTLEAVHDWTARLAGDLVTLRLMAAAYPVGDPRVYEERGDYFLKSTRLEPIADTVDALNLLELEILPHAAGVVGVFTNAIPSVTVAGLTCRTPAGHEFASGFLSHGPFRVLGTDDVARGAELGTLGAESKTKAQRLLEVAASDPRVSKLLTITSGTQREWFEIFKLLELVAEDTDLDTRAAWGKTSKNQLERVRQTANHHRHASTTHQLPKRPVPLNEARLIAQRVVMAWLERRLQQAKGKL